MLYGSILPNILSIAGIFPYYLHDDIAGIILWAACGYILASDPSLPVKKFIHHSKPNQLAVFTKKTTTYERVWSTDVGVLRMSLQK